jgi:ribosomal protein S18 acetylase RimI-like enzyme
MELDVDIRAMTSDDFDAAIAVARKLTAWFNDVGIEQITLAVPSHRGAVAEVDGEIVGFITWLIHEEGIGELTWMAVGEHHHRHGIGRRLLEFAEEDLRASGAGELRVDTLGDSVDYEPYERTRAFYRGSGFRDLKSVMTDDPGMPESLTLHKRL